MHRAIEAIHQARKQHLEIKEVYRPVCRDISQNVEANCVSIWFFSEARDSIQCQCFFDSDTDTFLHGQILTAEDHPAYFQTILTEQFIVAPDARNHPATRAFTESYFMPNGIVSLLDYIIHRKFQPVGIICCENAHSHRNWTQEDQRYLLQVATLLSFGMAT
ncbi:MAG: GAF domain-containing protein [Rhodospirillales bacterium]